MAKDLTSPLTSLGRTHVLVRPLPGHKGTAALLGDILLVHGGLTVGNYRIGMPRFAAICELLETFDIAFCEFDDDLRAIQWNSTFLEFFPEHAGYIHRGEHYSKNLRRFYQHRLATDELPDIERLVTEGIARHRHQQQPFDFVHRGRKLRVSSLPITGSGRVRIWKEIDATPGEIRSPEIPSFDALDFIADGACVTDREGAILASNDQFRALYDVPSGSAIVGKSLEEVLSAAWHDVSPVLGLSSMIRNRLRYDGAPFEVELPPATAGVASSHGIPAMA